MHNTSIEVPGATTKVSYSKVFLSLGELIIAEQPTYIWTVLGSCVSVVLYNPRKKVSALCHAQLAEDVVFGNFGSAATTGKYTKQVVLNDFRYVGNSINHMLEQMQSLGIKKNEIYASVYGGGNVITQFSRKIGDENFIMAYKVLEKHRIAIVRQDVGGSKSRTIRHFSDIGVTHVRVL